MPSSAPPTPGGGGYDGCSFDLTVAIADVLQSDHGWSFEQSDAWLERMGLWEEEV
jgi:hypothetical protein